MYKIMDFMSTLYQISLYINENIKITKIHHFSFRSSFIASLGSAIASTPIDVIRVNFYIN